MLLIVQHFLLIIHLLSIQHLPLLLLFSLSLSLSLSLSRALSLSLSLSLPLGHSQLPCSGGQKVRRLSRSFQQNRHICLGKSVRFFCVSFVRVHACARAVCVTLC